MYFLDYIEKNSFLLHNRPQVYQHGDYHTGNMMYTNGELYIIDFDRCDYGDPWEEFVRIIFTAETSVPFACGQLHGYFGGEPPMEFFRLLALYLAGNQLGAIGWARRFNEMDSSRALSAKVLHWYDNMRSVVPPWY